MMMQKTSSVWKIGIWLAVLLFGTTSCLYAQDRDFTSWAIAGFEYKVKPAFALSGKVEWRTKDDMGETDRWGLNVGGKYTVLPFLKVGAGYEIHYRNRGEDGWKFRHRYNVEGTLSTALQNFKLSLRERVQHTFDGDFDEFRLRSRVQLAYDISRWQLEPYVSVEMYNGLNRGDRFDIKRMRYRGGISIPLFPGWEADIFYCRQWESQRIKDIVGLECVYSF